ncbi:MAG TPA: hypothetical protein VLE27_05490 [Thermoanaerobaculia bacterium]|nr:hypothetical protein [Thermoanaerobaculia bacterium]
MPKRSYAHYVADWERVLAAVDANEVDLAVLEEVRSQLAATLEGLRTGLVRQDEVLAQYRVSTRVVQGLVTRGQDLSNRLRNGLKMKYGTKDDKLLQFGLQPFRPEARARARRESQKEKEEKPGPVVQTDSGS